MIKKILPIIIVLLAIYFGFSFFVASKITEPTARHIDVSADFIDKNYKDVVFKTSDNLTLKGWWFEPTRDKVIIFVPGILDNRTNAGYYGVHLTQELIMKGYGVMLYDPRARGDSEGSVRVKNEHLDVIAGVSFLENHGIEPKHIGIISYSSGSLAVLAAIKNINNIGPVILDSTPTNFLKDTEKILVKEQHIPSFFIPGIFFALNERYGFDIKGISPIDYMSKAQNIPFLFVHAIHDQSIPYQNSQDLFKYAGPKSKLILFPVGSHIETYKKNVDLYRKEVFLFIEQTFKD